MNIILHDTRVKGVNPASTSECILYPVFNTTPLEGIITLLAALSIAFDGLGTVKIWAHGYEDPNNHHGGLGIQFGQDDMTVNNVNKWAALQGKVKFIDVYSCAAADVQPGKENSKGRGDGIYLCTQLAVNSGAIVTASSYTQYYNPGFSFLFIDESMDFGKWEGDILFFRPDGKVVRSIYELFSTN